MPGRASRGGDRREVHTVSDLTPRAPAGTVRRFRRRCGRWIRACRRRPGRPQCRAGVEINDRRIRGRRLDLRDIGRVVDEFEEFVTGDIGLINSTSSNTQHASHNLAVRSSRTGFIRCASAAKSYAVKLRSQTTRDCTCSGTLPAFRRARPLNCSPGRAAFGGHDKRQRGSSSSVWDGSAAQPPSKLNRLRTQVVAVQDPVIHSIPFHSISGPGPVAPALARILRRIVPGDLPQRHRPAAGPLSRRRRSPGNLEVDGVRHRHDVTSRRRLSVSRSHRATSGEVWP